jgi:steroid delta-isomerase-like uncharacterized protein
LLRDRWSTSCVLEESQVVERVKERGAGGKTPGRPHAPADTVDLILDRGRAIDMSDSAAAGQSFYDSWEKRDFDAVEACMADDVSFHDAPQGEVLKGKAAVKDWYASWAAACPDSVAGATLVAASDDTAVFEGVWAGSNNGAFGPFPPTGRSVSLPWLNVLRFDDEGRIVGGAAYYDQLTVMIQLGHMAPPAGA